MKFPRLAEILTWPFTFRVRFVPLRHCHFLYLPYATRLVWPMSFLHSVTVRQVKIQSVIWSIHLLPVLPPQGQFFKRSRWPNPNIGVAQFATRRNNNNNYVITSGLGLGSSEFQSLCHMLVPVEEGSLWYSMRNLIKYVRLCHNRISVELNYATRKH